MTPDCNEPADDGKKHEPPDEEAMRDVAAERPPHVVFRLLPCDGWSIRAPDADILCPKRSILITSLFPIGLLSEVILF